MKLARVPGKPLQGGQRKMIDKMAVMPFKDTQMFSLAQIMGDIMDLIAGGSDTYMIIGATKDKSAVCITVYLEGSRDSVYGPDLLTAAEASGKWL